jgi:hypothetical protein
MGKLFELLAAEKTRVQQADVLVKETVSKFQKADQYFRGHTKTLKMIEESAANTAIENAARDEKAVVANVPDTLEYTLKFWAQAEDVIYQKNATNQRAVADLMFRGQVVEANVPVDELMGLEARLKDVRGMLTQIPTLDNSKSWEQDTNRGSGFYQTKTEDSTTKTEKVSVPIVLAPATDKHPAQVKESTTDKVVGEFITRHFSGCATTVGKSEAIAVVDELIVECRQARNRANTVDTVNVTIGKKITDLIMTALNTKE